MLRLKCPVVFAALGGHDTELRYSWSLARGGSLIKSLGDEPQLTIKSADPSNDYGIYRCEVDNDQGDTLGYAQAAVSVGYEAGASLFFTLMSVVVSLSHTKCLAACFDRARERSLNGAYRFSA